MHSLVDKSNYTLLLTKELDHNRYLTFSEMDLLNIILLPLRSLPNFTNSIPFWQHSSYFVPA